VKLPIGSRAVKETATVENVRLFGLFQSRFRYARTTNRSAWLALGLYLGCCASLLRAAESSDHIGPVTIELSDKTLVSGVLVDSTDDTLVLRTREGERKIDRKSVKSVKPGLATAPGKSEEAGDDLRIGKAANTQVVDDTPDAPLKKPTPKPEKKEGDGPADKILDAMKKGPDKGLVGDLPPPPAKPVVREPGRATPEKEWEHGFAQIDTGNYKAAASAFRATIGTGNTDELNKAEARARQKFNRSLPEVLVMCYSTVKCAQCKGDGVLQCEDCNGTGYFMKNIAGPGPAASVGGVKSVPSNSSSRPRIALCQKCHGNGFDVCMQCLGTGIGYSEPTSYEKDAYSAYFTRMAQETLGSSESSYGDTSRENMPTAIGGNSRTETNMDETIKQVWLRDSADRAKSDIIRLWRAEGFYRLSLKADPSLMIRSPKDLNQELIKIKVRRQNLYGELSERMRFKDYKSEE
jgi:hypothetical protein